MSNAKDGGPAFPCVEHNVNDGHYEGRYEIHAEHSGLSIRDYFAAKALSGLLANPGGPIQTNYACGWAPCNCDENDIAQFTYKLADAMLRARSGGQS